ncbi:MAG: hypothetical protein HQM08_19515 [Candidatus Riflebacteria bacterium]|nr:hypothetical protein [Candidatus Riflebacteria bacterium]
MKRTEIHLILILVTFFTALFSRNLFAQELIFYSIPPISSLDWSSPRALLFDSAIGNHLTFSLAKSKHVIGHVFIELKSQSGERLLAGATGAPDAPTDSDFILKEGLGLGLFYANFKGALDDPESLKRQIEERFKSGKISFMVFKLSLKTFDRLVYYLKEYHKRGYDKIYNGLCRPREGLGAGCTSFGMSFLEVGGLTRKEFVDNWQIHLKLPLDLIGGPITRKKVSVWQVIKENRWGKDGESVLPLDLYDPDLICKWIQKSWDQENFSRTQKDSTSNLSKLYGNVKLEKCGKALGLAFDCQEIPTPDEPVFLKEK